jgi:hypothetical protein
MKLTKEFGVLLSKDNKTTYVLTTTLKEIRRKETP